MTKRIISLMLIIIMSMTFSAFAEESYSSWAKDDIEKAIASGLVPESLRSDYKKSITRGEFAHIAVTFMNKIKGEGLKKAESVFTDTDDAYINSAYAMGLISGRGDGTFAPDATITRQEAAKVVANTYRAYAEKEVLFGKVPEFSDKSDIAEWAYEDIGILCYRNIMTGTGEGFEPFGLYTREQSIVTFMRLFRHLNDKYSQPNYNGKNTPITDYLRVSDGRLKSGDKEVVLKGINLGGWLIMETWMSPVLDTDEKMAYSDVIRILEKRFGNEKADELIELYENSFITEQDFERIEKLGFNCIRLPFWYRNFVSLDGEWKESAFEKLDFAVEQCEKRGIWLILDMHGCPGGQSMNHGTGTMGVNGLYNNEKNLALMEEIWRRIAERYRDTKCIAAYDIMNEPQNNDGYTGMRAWKAESKMAVQYTNSVYDRMVKAIREEDDEHIISVEGVWSMNVLPEPQKYDWDNMLYQLHIYDRTREMVDYRADEMETARDEWKVAVVAGEYNTGDLDEYASELFDDRGISRIKWTYKTVGNDLGNWGLFGREYEKIDIKKASYDEIKKAFGEDMKTENSFELNIKEYNSIK